MKFVWMGAEAPNDVDLLYGQGVRDFGISLSSFRRRVKSPQNNLDRYPDDSRLYLYDSGAWDTELDIEQLTELSEAYEKFVHQWFRSFHAFTEFDSPALGKEYAIERRGAFYDDDRFEDRFWVSWHPSHGIDHLKYLGESYTDVVVPVGALKEPHLFSIISAIRTEYQTAFHCNGFSADRALRHELFDSIFMSSWSSALKHGYLFIPVGQSWVQRVNDPVDQKAQVTRYGSFIEGLGCDPQLLIDGSVSERELYTVRLFRWLESGHSAILEVLSESSDTPSREVGSASADLVPDSGLQDSRKSGLRIVGNHYPEPAGSHYPITTLPTLATDTVPSLALDEDGKTVFSEVPLVRRSNETVRQCDSCSLSSNCPAFQPGNACKFKMPIQIRSREQMAALTEAILEMQASRIFFAQFAEEATGYHDPTVGKEMDRFAKLASVFAKIGESKETLRVEASRTTQGGVLSALFGERAKRLEQ